MTWKTQNYEIGSLLLKPRSRLSKLPLPLPVDLKPMKRSTTDGWSTEGEAEGVLE